MVRGWFQILRQRHPDWLIVVLFSTLGGLGSFGFAPYECWWLVWLQLVIIIVLLSRPVVVSPATGVDALINSPLLKSTWSAGLALLSWWAMLFSVSAHWLTFSLIHYGGLTSWLAHLLLLLLGVALGSFASLLGVIVYKFSQLRRYHLFYYALVWPTLWLLMEEAMARLGSCAWFSLAYTQLNNPLINLTSVVGARGVSFLLVQHAALTVYWGQLCWQCYNRWSVSDVQLASTARWRGSSTPMLFFLAYQLLLIGGSWGADYYQRMQIQPVANAWPVRVVQLAIPPEQKWADVGERHLQRYCDLTLHAPNQSASIAMPLIVVWPEGTLHDQLLAAENATLSTLQDNLRQHQMLLLSGGLTYQPDDTQPLHSGLPSQLRVYNSLLAIGWGQGVYHKQRLLPFGEYLPGRYSHYPIFAELARWLDGFIPFNDLQAGPQLTRPALAINATRTNDSLSPLAYPLAAAICSEIAYPELLACQLPAAVAIVTIADDSWFGQIGRAGWQHLAIARLRSIEFGRAQILANNSGPSAIIDQRGVLVAITQPQASALLDASLQPYQGQTLYNKLLNFISSLHIYTVF